MFIMAKEPLQNMSAAEVRARFAERNTEKDLADAFALTSNKFWWVEDNRYDYEAGTPEHQTAVIITDEWRALMKEYEKRIFAILISEGIAVPQTGRIKVLAHFMQRYGYTDGGGWWIKND